MMNVPTPPTVGAYAFSCPSCNAYSHQRWAGPPLRLSDNDGGSAMPLSDCRASMCVHCNNFALWVGINLVYPDVGVAPPPNVDMPDDAQGDYKEAVSVVARSPRAAAALLRLSIEKVCIYLTSEGHDLNAKIGILVQNGLRSEIQKALDTVRVIGNNAVHPGQMDLSDDHETCIGLFGLVNIIVHDRITQPKAIDELFSKLPDGAKNQIERRDSK